MRKTMCFKRFVSLLAVVLVLMMAMSVTVCAGTATEAKNSVVVVINQEGGHGTGFAIGEVGKSVEYIVTNNHVVMGEMYTTATVAFDMASNDMVSANVYFYDADKDFAILKLPQPTDKREAMVLCPMKYVDLDDTFAALGYPGGQATDWQQYNLNDITVTKGGIKKTDRLYGLDVYMLDLTITHGNSGGPLVNSNGEVVGVNWAGVNNDNYAIAIDELLKVIDTDRIPVTIHTEINWMLIIGAAVLLLVIILVIVLIVVLRKKKGKKIEPGNPTQPVDGVYVPPVQPRAKASARVIALGGALNGKKYAVSDTARMGRDSSKCAIAFPVNTQGVSAVHCDITFDGTVCYIKDLNSSYGTYTVTGEKLVPNVPHMLRSGDKFYLATPENTFEVRF